jgi:hypothetical protein
MAASERPLGAPKDVAAIRSEIQRFLDFATSDGKKIGAAKFGVYAFYDYDAEPVYVGQTNEMLRTRIRRHLTNQRTDAVAMNVLDPFEVAEIEVWPLWQFQSVNTNNTEAKTFLNSAEYTVFQLVLKKSSFKAVLNEKDVAPATRIKLPKSYRAKIVPDDLYFERKHPDIRIARRSTTIASLARVISERDVSKGLRRTLMTQARRLERLATERYREIGGTIPTAEAGEEV